MSIVHKTFVGEVKSFDDAELIIEHFISTETQDSGGDIMLAEGMKIRGKPVVLFQHGFDPLYGNEPIAKVLGIKVGVNKAGKKGLIATTQYYNGEHLTPPDSTGRRLYEKAKDGTMPNWSIGYNAIKEEPTTGGRIVTEWELHEYSQVAVGMNSEATTDVAVKFLIETPEAKTDQNDNSSEVKMEGSSHKRAHKAMQTMHRVLVADLKEYAAREDLADEGVKPMAKEAMEEFSENVKPHVEKYIKACMAMMADDKFGDEPVEDAPAETPGENPDKPDEETKGYRAKANALQGCLVETIKAIREFKGCKDIDATATAEKIMAEHVDKALPHAVEFIKEFAANLVKEKTSNEEQEKPSNSDTAGEEKASPVLNIIQPPVQKKEVVLTLKQEPTVQLSAGDIESLGQLVKDLFKKTMTEEINRLSGRITK